MENEHKGAPCDGYGLFGGCRHCAVAALEQARALGRAEEAAVHCARTNLTSLEVEIGLWRSVIIHPSGIGIDFAGGLISAQRKEDGTFEIEWEDDGIQVKSFVSSDSDGAARFFAEKRQELEYGLEFETEMRPPMTTRNDAPTTKADATEHVYAVYCDRSGPHLVSAAVLNHDECHVIIEHNASYAGFGGRLLGLGRCDFSPEAALERFRANAKSAVDHAARDLTEAESAYAVAMNFKPETK